MSNISPPVFDECHDKSENIVNPAKIGFLLRRFIESDPNQYLYTQNSFWCFMCNRVFKISNAECVDFCYECKVDGVSVRTVRVICSNCKKYCDSLK